MTTDQETAPSRTMIIAAFAAIYIVWGSTYLAIRVAVETLPAFLMASIRFLIAGGCLYLLMRIKGAPRPTQLQWKNAAITGTLLLLGGNGLVVWAEKHIPSSLAALLVALAPIWFALLDWARPGGLRPTRRTVVGIVLGFVGVFILLSSRPATESASKEHLPAAIAVIIASLLWSAGSLFGKHSEKPASPWINSAMQMICGGVSLLLVALIRREHLATEWSDISLRSLLACLYLIVFGSWIGFSAYVWLLKVSTPTRVATYAYVNPVIAVLLGWALLDEPLTLEVLWGAAVVVAGVVIITWPSKPKPVAEVVSGASPVAVK